MDNIKITYNNKTDEFPRGITVLEVSKKYSKYYKYDILAANVNDVIVSLNYVLDEDATIDFYDVSSNEGNKVYERTAILILSKAILDEYREQVRIEHSIDKGIFCALSNMTPKKLDVIKNRMHEIIEESVEIQKLNINRIKVIKYYELRKMYDKVNLLKYLSNTYITIYKLDNIYDYMYGEMAINTSYVKDFNLEYINKDGFVLMLPFTYNNNKVNKYVHHEKFFNSVMEYIDWSDKIGIRNVSDINKMLAEGKWNDLIFMSEATYNKNLLDISETISKNEDIKMVLIAGPSCSGKTTTSKKLEMFLESKGLNPVALSVDDYFKERIDTPLDEDGNKDYESINAIDTELFNDQLSRLLKGEEVILPTYNFITGQKEFKRRLKLKENAILIIEGLHSLNDELTKTIDKKNKYRIYISPLTCLNLDNHNRLNTTDNRLLRRLVRDNLRRGYNASETLDSWKRVRKGETEYVFPYQDKSDIVLNTSLIYEMNVLKVYAEPLLFSVNESDPNYIEAIRLINLLRMILPMPSASIPLDSVMREFIGNGCFE